MLSRALDEAVVGERGEDAVHGALAEPEPSRELGHAEHRVAVAER